MPLDQIDVDNMTQRTNSSGKEMTFLDHLEELRWHIIRSLLAIGVAGIVLFIFQDWLGDCLSLHFLGIMALYCARLA